MCVQAGDEGRRPCSRVVLVQGTWLSAWLFGQVLVALLRIYWQRRQSTGSSVTCESAVLLESRNLCMHLTRLLCAGLLQPVSQAHLGIVCSQQGSAAAASNGACNGCASSSSSQASLLSSSPARSASSCGPPPGFANGSLPSSSRAAGTPQRQQHTQQVPQQQQPQQGQRWGELRLPMQLGHPPADTAVFAPLMAALQELQVRTVC